MRGCEQKVAADAEVLHQRLGVMEDRERSYEGQLAALRQRSMHDQDKIKRLQRQLDQKSKVERARVVSCGALPCTVGVNASHRNLSGVCVCCVTTRGAQDLHNLTATFHRFIRSRIRQYEDAEESGTAPELGEFLSAQLEKSRRWRVLTPTKVREEGEEGSGGGAAGAPAGGEYHGAGDEAAASVRAVLPAKVRAGATCLTLVAACYPCSLCHIPHRCLCGFQLARLRQQQARQRRGRSATQGSPMQPVPLPSARPTAHDARSRSSSTDSQFDGGVGVEPATGTGSAQAGGDAELTTSGRVRFQAQVHPQGEGAGGRGDSPARQSSRRGRGTDRLARSTVSTASKRRRTPGTIVSRASRTTSAVPPYAQSEATSATQVPPRFANTPGVETSLLEGYEVIKRFERRSASATRARGPARAPQ